MNEKSTTSAGNSGRRRGGFSSVFSVNFKNAPGTHDSVEKPSDDDDDDEPDDDDDEYEDVSVEENNNESDDDEDLGDEDDEEEPSTDSAPVTSKEGEDVKSSSKALNEGTKQEEEGPVIVSKDQQTETKTKTKSSQGTTKTTTTYARSYMKASYVSTKRHTKLFHRKIFSSNQIMIL